MGDMKEAHASVRRAPAVTAPDARLLVSLTGRLVRVR